MRESLVLAYTPAGRPRPTFAARRGRFTLSPPSDRLVLTYMPADYPRPTLLLGAADSYFQLCPTRSSSPTSHPSILTRYLLLGATDWYFDLKK
jgi:hypothetical protein